MPKFYASTSRGLSEALSQELKEMNLKVIQVDKQGCAFEGPWSDCVKANIRSRLATRIVLQILDFSAYKAEELYNNVKKHDFTKYLKTNMTFLIKAKINACAIKDQRLLAMKVKDVIADQFNKKWGTRPDIDKESPDVRFFIFGSKNEYRLSVDTTGYSLSQRGYRKESTEAPLREHLAAGLIQLTGWNKKIPLVDPLCGSGTLLIEAALMLRNISPGSFHKKFSFQSFSHIPKKLFEEELEKAMAEENNEPDFKLFGFDRSWKNIEAAKKNAERAGVDDLIVFTKTNALSLLPPVSKGLIVTNPPHGIRLGDEFFLEEFYKDFAYNLKKNFPGWPLWMLSGDPKWTKFLKMKAGKYYSIDNGGIDCRWIHYPINKS